MSIVLHGFSKACSHGDSRTPKEPGEVANPPVAQAQNWLNIASLIKTSGKGSSDSRYGEIFYLFLKGAATLYCKGVWIQ